MQHTTNTNGACSHHQSKQISIKKYNSLTRNIKSTLWIRCEIRWNSNAQCVSIVFSQSWLVDFAICPYVRCNLGRHTDDIDFPLCLLWQSCTVWGSIRKTQYSAKLSVWWCVLHVELEYPSFVTVAYWLAARRMRVELLSNVTAAGYGDAERLLLPAFVSFSFSCIMVEVARKRCGKCYQMN